MEKRFYCRGSFIFDGNIVNSVEIKNSNYKLKEIIYLKSIKKYFRVSKSILDVFTGNKKVYFVEVKNLNAFKKIKCRLFGKNINIRRH